jgi:NADPH-dependent 2,4-dienoyl-CoA reductase/sulfur reductase-like enzyme
VPRSVVVVGAGLAGTQTVGALREHGFDVRITVLGAEGVRPYDRPPLSKELISRPEPVWLSEDIGVDIAALADDVRLADPAARLRVTPNAVVVETTSGDDVTADAVVLATGSTPVRPPGWESAWTLHTADDAARLRAALRPGLRLVIVGAGWIGAELAGVAAREGADVTVVEAAATPLDRQLGAAVGAHLAPWYAAAGVRLLTAVRVTGVNIGAAGVTVDTDRQLPADVVVAAVGARPATGWLRGDLPLDATGRVHVDAAGAALARVWAVGDIAVRHHPVFGPVPGGHWSAALHDPQVTVRAMLGLDPSPADPEHLRAQLGLAPITRHAPYVFSRQLDHDLALVGLPADTDAVLLRGDPAAGGPWAAFYVDRTGDHAVDHRPETASDGHLTSQVQPAQVQPARVRAVLLVDSPREVGALRRLMGAAEPLRVDLTRALDPATRLRDAALPPTGR